MRGGNEDGAPPDSGYTPQRLLGCGKSEPIVQTLIREEIERYLREIRGNSGEEKAALTARKQKLGKEKDNLVEAIAAGVLSNEDAKTRMDRVREDLQDVEQKLARLGAPARNGETGSGSSSSLTTTIGVT